MKGYAQMSKENVISLAEKAIEKILKERGRRKACAICEYRDRFKPSLLQRLGLKSIPELTDEYVVECIKYRSACMWDWEYNLLMYFGSDLIASMKQLISAAKVSEDYVLVEVGLAAELYEWS